MANFFSFTDDEEDVDEPGEADIANKNLTPNTTRKKTVSATPTPSGLNASDFEQFQTMMGNTPMQNPAFQPWIYPPNPMMSAAFGAMSGSPYGQPGFEFQQGRPFKEPEQLADLVPPFAKPAATMHDWDTNHVYGSQKMKDALEVTSWHPRHSRAHLTLKLLGALPRETNDHKLAELSEKPATASLIQAIEHRDDLDFDDEHIHAESSLGTMLRQLFREILWAADALVTTTHVATDKVVRAFTRCSNVEVLDDNETAFTSGQKISAETASDTEASKLCIYDLMSGHGDSFLVVRAVSGHVECQRYSSSWPLATSFRIGRVTPHTRASARRIRWMCPPGTPTTHRRTWR